MAQQKHAIPKKVRAAIRQCLSDIQEGVVSFDADDYEPIIAKWLDDLEENESKSELRPSHVPDDGI